MGKISAYYIDHVVNPITTDEWESYCIDDNEIRNILKLKDVNFELLFKGDDEVHDRIYSDILPQIKNGFKQRTIILKISDGTYVSYEIFHMYLIKEWSMLSDGVARLSIFTSTGIPVFGTRNEV